MLMTTKGQSAEKPVPVLVLALVPPPPPPLLPFAAAATLVSVAAAAADASAPGIPSTSTTFSTVDDDIFAVAAAPLAACGLTGCLRCPPVGWALRYSETAARRAEPLPFVRAWSSVCYQKIFLFYKLRIFIST